MATSTTSTHSRVEPGRCTTRYEPAGTTRGSKVPASDGFKPSTDRSAARSADGGVPGTSDDRIRCAPAEACDEASLFAVGQGPRLFGEGSYLTGGSTAEGNYALPDSNPRGGYGSFSDAGGFGSPQLLGETEPACRQVSSEGESRARAQASTAEQTNDTRHSAGVPASVDLIDGQCFKHD
jgi:hypothetical protein